MLNYFDIYLTNLKYLSECDDLYVDGEFKSCPKPFYKLFLELNVFCKFFFFQYTFWTFLIFL